MRQGCDMSHVSGAAPGYGVTDWEQGVPCLLPSPANVPGAAAEITTFGDLLILHPETASIASIAMHLAWDRTLSWHEEQMVNGSVCCSAPAAAAARVAKRQLTVEDTVFVALLGTEEDQQQAPAPQLGDNRSMTPETVSPVGGLLVDGHSTRHTVHNCYTCDATIDVCASSNPCIRTCCALPVQGLIAIMR